MSTADCSIFAPSCQQSVSYVNFLSQLQKLLDNFSSCQAVCTVSRLIGNGNGNAQIGNVQIGNSQIKNVQIGNTQIGSCMGNAEIGRMEWPFLATINNLSCTFCFWLDFSATMCVGGT